MVLEKVAAPVVNRVFENVELPVTDKVLEKTTFPVTVMFLENAAVFITDKELLTVALELNKAFDENVTLEDTVMVLDVEMFPPLRLSVTTIMLAEK
jgi:hypothetical protein